MRINDEMRYLWRAVDHEGEVLESFVTTTRDKAVALKFIKKALKRHGRPRTIVTDGLRSYGTALKEIGGAYLQVPVDWRDIHAGVAFADSSWRRFRDTVRNLERTGGVRD